MNISRAFLKDIENIIKKARTKILNYFTMSKSSFQVINNADY